MDMIEHVQRAHTLIEALPYLQQFANKTVVVKYGGHAMTDEALRHSFARDRSEERRVGKECRL